MDPQHKDEYLDASQNMRHYGQMRFAILTLSLAITAGLITATPVEPASAGRFKVGIAGILTSIVFWVMDERAMLHFARYRRRAIELEAALGFKQHGARVEIEHPSRIATSHNAVRLLYGGTLSWWLAAMFGI